MNFKKISLFSVMFCAIFVVSVKAQEDVEDYSQYANVETTGAPTKNYCTSKIVGGSPSKLISVGYDFQGSNTLTAGAYGSYLSEKAEIKNNSGLRVMANLPIIANVKWIVTLGANYAETKYDFSSSTVANNPLVASLKKNGLTTMGLNSTVFKPLNSKFFILAQTSFDWSGDYALGKMPEGNQLKISGAVLFGKKKNDRTIFALGLSRTYRGGQQAYLPILLYNRTFSSKWGIECLLPARASVRYSLNPRKMLFAGFESEGNSYRLNNMMKDFSSQYSALELRRSELRVRLAYEFSVYKFCWLSLQAGYRINYNYKMDDGEFMGRKQNYISENILTNPFYMMVSLNLVSP